MRACRSLAFALTVLVVAFGTLVAVLGTAVAGATPRAAAPYPPPACPAVSLTPSTVVAGRTVTFSGTGFTPNAVATVQLIKPPTVTTLASKRAQADGSWTATVRIPATMTAGQYTMRAAAQQLEACRFDRGTDASLQVDAASGNRSGGSAGAAPVASGGSGGTGGLSSTGAQIATLLAIAAVLLLAGLTFSGAGRRRRGLTVTR